ncbi:PREDICTED: endothelial cell-selective adhesion molecule [Elephantulus edwardii]|uniref:endothelial cell-selective adhesion molecule n=1 Tax=Elephantulus edwardii TaxID=28737 RepID=UPI0003F0CB06|nr:PREDICTED: endothelial cell-selective adhesion molecule [Elephantulus edwardii]
MVCLPGPLAAKLSQFLLLWLSALALPGRAQVELHVPAGLSKVEAVEGEEVVLPMWYTLRDGMPSVGLKEKPWVLWFLEKTKTSQVLAYSEGTSSGKHGASLVYTMPSRNVSLRLQNLKEEDSGSYRCSVNVYDSQHRPLGDSSSSLELNVLVPPAPPSCRILDAPFLGSNVTLSCQSSRSKPTAHYQWEKLPPSPQVFFAPTLDNIRGSLKLINLSPSMSGIYVCKAYNEVGTSKCNVTLVVSTGPGYAVITGAVVGILIGLGLLVGLILLYQRWSKTQEEPANDIKEDAIAPRTLPWPKGSDTISKNGTLSSVTSARALRSPHGHPRPGASTPTPSLSTQALPSPKLPRVNEAHPTPVLASPGGISSSALSRMGAVPVLMPAKNQAGSLV